MASVFDHHLFIGDTLRGNDLVVRHYEQLPYPQFNDEMISKEEQYYASTAENVYTFYQSQTLEKINHYLFQGGENFE